MNGEWGIFVPVAAANATAAAAAAGEAAAAAGEAEAEEEGETDVEGTFNTAIATPAGNQKTDILFTGNVSTIKGPTPSDNDTNLHPGSRKPRSRGQRHSCQRRGRRQWQPNWQPSHRLPLCRPTIVQDLH